MREHGVAARRKRANEVRLNAIQEKTRKAEFLQAQIKESLQGLDERVKNATHITFSDSEDEVEKEALSIKKENPEHPPDSKADALLGFGDSDSEDEINIDLKPQFKGKKGERLLELQSSYGNDARFRLDQRFAEDVSTSSCDDEAAVVEDEDGHPKSELEKNLQLLNQVIGHNITSSDQAKKRVSKFIDISSRRYDPATDVHLEVIVDKSVKAKPNKKKKKDESKIPEADSIKYYEMSTGALRDAFAPKTEESASTSDKGFSFLSMLGRADDKVDHGNISRKAAKMTDRPMDLGSMRKEIPTLDTRHFYDSSETEDDEEVEEGVADKKTYERESKVEGLSGREQCSSFFLSSKWDLRIVDGVKEFCWNKPFAQVQQEWLEVKDTLIKDYKKKHRDAKRKQRKTKYEARMLATNSDT